MESVAKKMNSLFELGQTNEEIVQSYAKEGVQVPEQLVNKFREQYKKDNSFVPPNAAYFALANKK